jgi:hypothetical protein
MSIEISIKEGWVNLEVSGDIRISYPVFGDKDSRDEKIDEFAEALKRALSGERLSTLD